MNGTISQAMANVTGKTASKSNISKFAIVCIVSNFFLVIAYIYLKYFSANDLMWLCSGFTWLFFLILTFLLLIIATGRFIFLRTNIKRAAFPFLPFLINGTIFLTFWLVPVHAIMSALKFRLMKDRYKKIISMVEDGHIQPDNKSLAELPLKYRHLSRGGDIFIDKGDKVMTILIHTSFKFELSLNFDKGLTLTRLAGLSGYMYRSDGTLPPQFFKRLDWVHVEGIEPNWFYYDARIPR